MSDDIFELEDGLATMIPSERPPVRYFYRNHGRAAISEVERLDL